jgi:hypothetical protein
LFQLFKTESPLPRAAASRTDASLGLKEEETTGSVLLLLLFRCSLLGLIFEEA